MARLGIVVVVVALCGGLFAYWLSIPRSYADCVLKNLPDAPGRTGASLVHRACREKFPAFDPRTARPAD